MSEIGTRAKKVLHAVVSEYLATGEAVGSQTVARRYSLEVSPATVRNVMSDLEEMGLLRHQHTSAGRIPTDRGLRYYVDTLLRVRTLSQGEKEDVRGRMSGGAGADVPEMMHNASRVLRELSHLTVIVQAPRFDADVVEHIEFVRLREGQLLAIIAGSSGHVQNKLLAIDTPISQGDLEKVNNYLNGLVGGLTLDQVRLRLAKELETERAVQDETTSRALRLAAQAVPSASVGLIVEGQSNLVAGLSDLDRAKAALRALEERDVVLRLLERTLSAPGICVFIGSEVSLADTTDLSMVASSYGGEGRPLGTIGVIGPSRMNYSKVIPLVDFTAEMLSDSLPKR